MILSYIGDGSPIAPAVKGETPNNSAGGTPQLKTALLIDDDLGFVFWLGHSLDAAAYSALPAKSIPDAALLVMQLDLRVDVLIINLALAGSVDFLAALHRSQKDIRVIGIVESSDQQMEYYPGVHAFQSKPTTLDDAARNEWVRCIDRILMNSEAYRSFI